MLRDVLLDLANHLFSPFLPLVNVRGVHLLKQSLVAIEDLLALLRDPTSTIKPPVTS